MGIPAYLQVDAALGRLLVEAAAPGQEHTKRAIEEFERCLKMLFTEEDKEQGDAVVHGVVAQKRILDCERESLLKQLTELKGWFASAIPNYDSSPVASTVDALARGLKRYFEDESEFEQERELADTPAMD